MSLGGLCNYHFKQNYYSHTKNVSNYELLFTPSKSARLTDQKLKSLLFQLALFE